MNRFLKWPLIYYWNYSTQWPKDGEWYGIIPSHNPNDRCRLELSGLIFNDLTVLPNSGIMVFIREIIPKWPNISGQWNMIIYPELCNLWRFFVMGWSPSALRFWVLACYPFGVSDVEAVSVVASHGDSTAAIPIIPSPELKT